MPRLRGPLLARPRRGDDSCCWRKAAVRLDKILAANILDVRRAACCFQQALQVPSILIPTCVLFTSCLPGCKEHAAQHPCVKLLLVLPFCPFFFFSYLQATISEGSFNCALAFPWLDREARAVVLTF